MQPKCSDDMLLAAVVVDGFYTNQILPYALYSPEVILGSKYRMSTHMQGQVREDIDLWYHNRKSDSKTIFMKMTW